MTDSCSRGIREGVEDAGWTERGPAMKVSYLETGRYVLPPGLPREWPVPGAAYDPDIGAEAYRGMVERIRFVEELGFDWVTLLQDDVTRNIAGERPPANVGGVLPISFCGGLTGWSSRSAAAARKSAPASSTCHCR